MTDAVLANSEEARANREQFLREVAEFDGERSGLKVIPTVVHIIHNNGSENLTKETIINAIEEVNLELTAQNSNLSSIVSSFQPIIGNAQFELRLAKIDPNGDCTDGITRTESQLTYDAGENVKDLINWNDGSRKYLQVWLVFSLSNQAGGYTFLPGTTGAHNNGIIIRAAQFQQSLTHEFGHWTNLNHTWGPTNEPGNTSNCSFDDGISDTPNTIGSSGCNTSQISCGSLDNVQNFMDYSGCERMFTLEQASTMQAAANSSTGGRNQYWAASNLIATGTNDGYSSSCTPTVDFALSSDHGCEGFTVNFSDNSWGADQDATWQWNWNFPGGSPSSSTDQEPSVTYNTAGTYNVSLTITTAAGAETHTIQNAVVVSQYGGGIVGPYLEGMEDAGFPNNADPNMVWTIESPGGLTWQRSTAASYSGGASARINLRSITSGKTHSLISPPLDLSNVENADATMTFRLAHSNRNSTDHTERLRVYVSRNCGETWSLRYNKYGDNLNTAGANVGSTFVPDASDWRLEELNLSGMGGEGHVLVKFEATSDQQSYLYLDDINITPNAPMGIAENTAVQNARIYPNPINGTSQLEIVLSEATHTTLSIVNMVGQQLAVIDRKLPAGVTRIALDSYASDLNAGVYLLHIRTDKGSDVIRFVKN